MVPQFLRAPSILFILLVAGLSCTVFSPNTVSPNASSPNTSSTLASSSPAPKPETPGQEIAATSEEMERQAPPIIDLVAGVDHSCALTEDGRVFCWGSALFYQLGPRRAPDDGLPAFVEGIEDAVSIAAGARETCVLSRRGEIKCWGEVFGAAPLTFEVPEPIEAISVGFGVVALSRSGRVYTYASPEPGVEAGPLILTQKAGLEDIVEISAGLPRCALHREGIVSCWSDDDYIMWPGEGALVKVEGIDRAVSLSKGLFHHCAIEEDKSVKCWGLNRYGGLGNGASGADPSGRWQYSVEAVPALGVRDARAVFTGGLSSCALLERDEVKCWGANTYGQLGLPVETPDEVIPAAVAPHVLVATKVPGTKEKIVAMTLGHHHRCALLATNEIRCWGLNRSHQLGVPFKRFVTRPAPVPHARNMVAVRAGWDRTCGLTAEGEVQCWGGLAPDFDVDIHQGQTFDIPTITPKAVQGIEKAQAVAMHTSHACGLGDDAILSCFGKNSAAALGPDTTHVFTAEARAYVELGPIRAFDVGGFHTCVVREDQNLWCWGGINGRVGSENRVYTPQRVAGFDKVEAIAGGGSQTCAREQSGRVSCWGEDLILELNGLFDEETLLEIPDFKGALELSAGEAHVCARLPEGQVRCLGGLPVQGPGGLISPDPPYVQTFLIEGFDEVVQLAGGENFVCGRTHEGRVRCAGRNEVGQLGDGTRLSRAHGLDVLDLEDVIDIGAGRHHACAVVKTGRVYCWGSNTGMQLGIEAGYSIEGRKAFNPYSSSRWQNSIDDVR